ncbi:MAG TPA: aminoacyl-tRNA deacylase [Enteractinococcus sp.]
MNAIARGATPALKVLADANVWHQVSTYDHLGSDAGFGQQAATQLGIEPERIYKTLCVVTETGHFVNAVIAVADMLHTKRLAAALKTKQVEMADPRVAQHKTGYVLGGISPLGQKLRARLVADTSVYNHETMWVSAGRRGMSVEVRVQDFLLLTDATVAEIRR